MQHNRSPAWYLIFALVALGFLSFAVYTHSLLTFITFILIILTVLAISIQPAREITYKVTTTSISAGNIVYPFKIIKKFWITYNPPIVKTLKFETTAYINNKITLQLGSLDPVLLKLVLSQYLPEDLDAEETFAETMARRLKI